MHSNKTTLKHQDPTDCQTGGYVTSLPIWLDQCVPFTTRQCEKDLFRLVGKRRISYQYQKYILLGPSKLIRDRDLSHSHSWKGARVIWKMTVSVV